MPDQPERIFDSKPSPYPKSSTPEMESWDIFNYLLHRQYVKGHPNVMDKNPNWDGILELTDEQNYPIGKIQVQLRTLRADFTNNPRQQCDQAFFSSCEAEALPVFIIVVDKQNELAYWRHIDRSTLLEVKENIKGDSYLLSIPIENRLDGIDQSYLSQWMDIAKEASIKAWNYDSVVQRKKAIEMELESVKMKLQVPVNIPSHALREIHDFLDEYNYILDKEFGIVKQVIYPDYWKIGMGVIRYGFGNVSYILFPVEYDKAQLLIKEVEPGYDYLGKEMAVGNVLLWAAKEDTKDLTINRVPYSYKLLEDQVMRVAGKYNFPFADLFLANEYLISFIDKFQEYFNLEKQQETYSLKDLKYMLYNVIPMMVATNHSFGDHVVTCDHSIDSYDRFRAYEGHKKQIAEATKKINQGFQPKVSVTVVSQRYSIELIHYYIGLLESKGLTVTKRQYKSGMRDENMYNVPLWKTWNKEVLWFNIKQFFSHFYQLYHDYIRIHFVNIRQHLQIVESDEITIVHILHFDEKHTIPPHMEVYHLRPEIPSKGSILTFLAEDSSNPIDRRKYFLDREFSCVIDGKRYQVILMHGQPLDFMFTDSPTYSLINENLTELLQKFFRTQKNRVSG